MSNLSCGGVAFKKRKREQGDVLEPRTEEETVCTRLGTDQTKDWASENKTTPHKKGGNRVPQAQALFVALFEIRPHLKDGPKIEVRSAWRGGGQQENGRGRAQVGRPS